MWSTSTAAPASVHASSLCADECSPLTTLREKVKIGAKVIAHARYTVFQMAEVAVPRELFRQILDLIDNLRPRPMAQC
jgi:hypothetical protein